MRVQIALVLAIIVSACGGGSEGGGSVTEPPTETFTWSAMTPAEGNTIRNTNPVVSFSVGVSSSYMMSIPDANISWKVSGVSQGSGKSVSLTLSSGVNQVCVEARGVLTSDTKCSTYTFTPGVACSLSPAHSYSEALEQTLRITYTVNGQSLSRLVGADGDCSIEGSALFNPRDTVKVVVDREGSDVWKYHPLIARVLPSELALGLGVVLSPHQWKITNSTEFEGHVVSTSLSKADTGGLDHQTFFESHKVDGTNLYWFTQSTHIDFPLPLVFADQFPMDLRDSVMKALEYVKNVTGIDMARPYKLGDPTDPAHAMVINIDPKGCTGNFVSGDQGRACAGSSWTPERVNSTGCSITLVNPSQYNSFLGVMIHELTHCLVIGHGCGWSGVMSAECPGLPMWPTLQENDVAYIQLYYRVVALERKYSGQTILGLGESYQGERVFERGLPEQNVTRKGPSIQDQLNRIPIMVGHP